jgi:hypothetical protein
MTTLHIEIPDDRAAALRAKAQAQGLSLEEYFRNLAEREAQATTAPQAPEQRGSVVQEMRKLRARIKPDPEGWTTRDYVNYGRP